jgi:hypothetical protein
MSMPYTLGYRMGGAALDRYTFLAPASRAICMISVAVVPLTIESSTSRTFRPANSDLIVFSLRRTDFFLVSCPGMMNVRAM